MVPRERPRRGLLDGARASGGGAPGAVKAGWEVRPCGPRTREPLDKGSAPSGRGRLSGRIAREAAVPDLRVRRSAEATRPAERYHRTVPQCVLCSDLLGRWREGGPVVLRVDRSSLQVRPALVALVELGDHLSPLSPRRRFVLKGSRVIGLLQSLVTVIAEPVLGGILPSAVGAGDLIVRVAGHGREEVDRRMKVAVVLGGRGRRGLPRAHLVPPKGSCGRRL